MNVLILGANGFIGSHLVESILAKKNWHITAMDLRDHHLKAYLDHPQLQFHIGDIRENAAWIETQIKTCDVVLPLVAIATPATYVKDPIAVFELDFEANLSIIRLCVKHQKRIIFPSTSEVYGLCSDEVFNEETSFLVTGPIEKERWIYSTSKQLLDRLIYAYGKHQGLSYTLFRPFNWYGPRLDNISNPNPGGSRVLTQFIGNILRGEAIELVNGGEQKRCFTYIEDGIAALINIIENENACHNKIINIGNPTENISIKQLATDLIALISAHFPQYQMLARKVKLQTIGAQAYYGNGYQDVNLRVPCIKNAKKYLNWEPITNLQTGLLRTLKFYLEVLDPI